MPTSPRIVSLLPSATEMLCALDYTEALVGISHECDFPAEITHLPVVTAARVDASADAAAIDTAVRDLLQAGQEIYQLDTELLTQLRPDIIVTQAQCDVCAVSEQRVKDLVRTHMPHTRIVTLQADTLDGIFTDIQHLATALDCTDRATTLCAEMQAQFTAIRQRVQRARWRPRVACIEWTAPLMLASNWVPELVELCGGSPCLTTAGTHSSTVAWDALAEAAPEVIVSMPCGYTREQARNATLALAQHPQWAALPAVRNRRVYAVDGNAYFNRPGPRIVESAALLAGLIQPGLLAAKMPADSYCRLDT